MWEKLLSLNLATNKIVTYTLLALFSLSVMVWLFGGDIVAMWITETLDINIRDESKDGIVTVHESELRRWWQLKQKP